MITKDHVREAIIAAGIQVDPDSIPLEARILDYMDSLDLFSVLVELEVIAGIKIPDEKATSFAALITFCNSHSG